MHFLQIKRKNKLHSPTTSLCCQKHNFFPDDILALLNSITVLDLSIKALQYIESSQVSETIKV